MVSFFTFNQCFKLRTFIAIRGYPSFQKQLYFAVTYYGVV